MLQVSHSQCPSLSQYDYQSSFSSSPIVLEISSSIFPPLSLGTYYAAVVPEFSLGSCFVNNTYFSIGACFGNNCTVLSPTTGTRNPFLKKIISLFRNNHGFTLHHSRLHHHFWFLRCHHQFSHLKCNHSSNFPAALCHRHPFRLLEKECVPLKLC
jgi:hypothetical protein